MKHAGNASIEWKWCKMTNKEIMQIALQQSAYDCNCNPEDFLSNKNIVTLIIDSYIIVLANQK